MKRTLVFVSILSLLFFYTHAWASEGDPVLLDSDGGISTPANDGYHHLNVSNSGAESFTEVDGDTWYRKDTDMYYIYDGSEWDWLIQNEAFEGNTETGITVTAQTDGTVDFVVDVTPDSTTTFTNKTIDADGTGNSLSNIDEDNCKDASDLVRDGIEFIIDGGGSAITTGEKGHLEIPYNCTIKRVVDLWVDTYANFPPTDADSITASAVPTISSAQKSQDTTLSGWTTSLTAGSIIAYNVDSCSTIERVTISLVVEK